MTPALLIGREPGQELGYCYVTEPPYEAVVIGSLSLGQLLRFREERVLEALAQGKQVLLYTPGLPQVPRNRALAGSLASARRELKNGACCLRTVAGSGLSPQRKPDGCGSGGSTLALMPC